MFSNLNPVIEIHKAVILHNGYGTDLIILHTNLPSSLPKVSEQLTTVTFSAEKDTGKEYVLRNIGNIEIEEIFS
jgi:hypothetical protein